MRDGRIRRAIKAVARWNFAVNLAVTRAWRRRKGNRPHELGGECRRCARCCEEPGIQVGRITWYVPRVRHLFLAWQRRVNGFELTGRDVPGRTFLFCCTHFDRATRTCDSYESRPGMCRDYPRVLLDQVAPGLLPGCGYRAVAPNAQRLLRILAGQRLSPEQREQLRRDLYLGGS